MNLFIERHQQLMVALLQAKVDFIIIGGYPVIYYGYKRTTGDVDVWIKPDNENKNRLLGTLQKLGIDQKQLKNISTMDFTKHLVVSIWEEPEKVDFITYINLVSYDEADKEKVMADIEGVKIPFIHINHLVLSKINTGRLKDRADIEVLQKIQKLKNKK